MNRGSTPLASKCFVIKYLYGKADAADNRSAENVCEGLLAGPLPFCQHFEFADGSRSQRFKADLKSGMGRASGAEFRLLPLATLANVGEYLSQFRARTTARSFARCHLKQRGHGFLGVGIALGR
jgi:hypothetical protein